MTLKLCCCWREQKVEEYEELTEHDTAGRAVVSEVKLVVSNNEEI